MRAYLPRTPEGVTILGRVAASMALRRRHEALGVRIVETLAQFGIVNVDDRTRPPPTLHEDVDVRLIAATTIPRTRTPVIPTGHEVLVVDDEVVVLTVLREALRRGGYRVTTAASAEEAIDLMQQRRFDLVLTDKNLPGRVGPGRVARGAHGDAVAGDRAHHRLQLVRLGARGAGHRRARLHREADPTTSRILRFRIRRALSRRDEQLARPRLATTGGRSGRVLLVEVEGARRQLISDYLGKQYHVPPARDGDEALALIKHEHYDLVLADRHLPGVSGLRVIEHAQRLLPHCASVLVHSLPVVRVGQGGVRDRRRRVHGEAERGSEKVGGEGRRSAQRSGRNPVRVTARAIVANGRPTCESRSRTTSGSPTAKKRPSSTPSRPSTPSPTRCAPAGTRSRRSRSSGPASHLAARIEAFAPDLIFNTAEGRRGRAREAFYPALFEELGFPYTGSDAYVLTVTLDKWLTKLVLARAGRRHAARRGW